MAKQSLGIKISQSDHVRFILLNGSLWYRHEDVYEVKYKMAKLSLGDQD